MKLLKDVKCLLVGYGSRVFINEFEQIKALSHDRLNYINSLKKLKSKLLKIKELMRSDKRRVNIKVTHNKKGFQIYLIN